MSTGFNSVALNCSSMRWVTFRIVDTFSVSYIIKISHKHMLLPHLSGMPNIDRIIFQRDWGVALKVNTQIKVNKLNYQNNMY